MVKPWRESPPLVNFPHQVNTWDPARSQETSCTPPLPALALTTAAALTLTPLVLPPPTTPLHLSLPQVSAPRLELTAAINPALASSAW